MAFRFVTMWAALVLGAYAEASRPSGHTSLFYSDASGKFLPLKHRPDIEDVYIVGSDLTSLVAEDFRSLPNVENLFIANCSLPLSPERSLFGELRALKELTASRCNLSDDFALLFKNNTKLKKLTLGGNRIRRVDSSSFAHLSALETLDLSDNYVSEVAADAFEVLSSLRKLNLSANHLGEGYSLCRLPEDASCAECGGRTSDAQEGDAAVKTLWRAFEGREGLLLEGNPACDALEGEGKGEEREEGKKGKEGGDGGCEAMERRRRFLRAACSAAGLQTTSTEPWQKPTEEPNRTTLPWKETQRNTTTGASPLSDDPQTRAGSPTGPPKLVVVVALLLVVAGMSTIVVAYHRSTPRNAFPMKEETAENGVEMQPMPSPDVELALSGSAQQPLLVHTACRIVLEIME